MTWVAVSVPTTQGMFSSRLTMAACDGDAAFVGDYGAGHLHEWDKVGVSHGGHENVSFLHVAVGVIEVENNFSFAYAVSSSSSGDSSYHYF